jgi:hypothetical protein
LKWNTDPNVRTKTTRPGTLAHAYNPIFSGGGDWEDCSLRLTLEQKVCEAPSQLISWVWWYVPLFPVIWEVEIEGTLSRSAWAKTKDSIRKITKQKRTGGMIQVVECMPSKCEALSSNPHTAL